MATPSKKNSSGNKGKGYSELDQAEDGLMVHAVALATPSKNGSDKGQGYSELEQAEDGLMVRAVPVEDDLMAHAVPILPIVKVVITKEAKTTKIGVAWRQGPDGILVREIRKGSLADQTNLRVGMKLLSINQINFEHSKTANNVATTLSGLEGEVTIIVGEKNVIYSTVLKENSNSLGIELSSTTGKDVVISSIREGSLLSKSRLCVGNTLLMVNNRNCTRMTVSEVDALLKGIPVGSLATIYVEEDMQTKARASFVPRHHADGRPPPFGVEPGGKWGTNTYHGSETTCTSMICCFGCGLISASIICCHPFDKRRAYMVNRKVYNSDGVFLGASQELFKDEDLVGNVDEDKKWTSIMLAGGVGLIFTVIYIMLRISVD